MPRSKKLSPPPEVEAASSLLLLHNAASDVLLSPSCRVDVDIETDASKERRSIMRRRQLPTRRTAAMEEHQQHFPTGALRKPRLPVPDGGEFGMYEILKKRLQAEDHSSRMRAQTESENDEHTVVITGPPPRMQTLAEALPPTSRHREEKQSVVRIVTQEKALGSENNGSSYHRAMSSPKQQQQLQHAEEHEDEVEGTYLYPEYRAEDVLCGRDKISYNHPGNKRFQAIISAHAKKYQSAPSRTDKTRITDEIIKSIRASGGRFLKLDDETGMYEDVGDDYAHEKVSHALRSSKEPKKRGGPRKKRKVVRKPPTERENQIFQALYAEQQRIFKQLVAKAIESSQIPQI